MKIMKLWPLLPAAAVMAIAPLPVRGREAPLAATPTPSANLELARQLNQAFVQVAADVSPAVVVITVTQKASAAPRLDAGGENDDEENPFDRLPPEFRRWLRPRRDQAPEKTIGQGSGVIIRADGYILTNRHVVEDAEKIEVRLKDGRTFKAAIRGVDAPADVAVIKIDAQNLPVARLADSDKTRVGEFAIAIGAPFALDYSVTFGHVSAKDRSNISAEPGLSMTDQSFIQTDANINPGNSGGPLVNIDGEVIGINTLIRGLHTGIGFAIPSNMAREVADKLITDGKFSRSWLGIKISSLREYPEYRDFVPGVREGVVVTEIVPDGPAAKSDLHPTDVITAVDGKPVVTSQQLKDEIRSKKAGQNLTLTVFRKGDLVKLQVKPGEWAEGDAALSRNGSSKEDGSTGSLGLTVETLTRELADKFDVGTIDGVMVTSVDENGLAARTGIKPGDVITEINRKSIKNLRQYREAVKNLDTKKGVIINLVSDGAKKFEILKDGGD
jgi:serine protease Do